MIPIEVSLESRACPNGCVKSDEDLFTARDRLNDLPGDYTLVRCRGCGLIRTDPRPTPETMGHYYPANYGPYISSQVVALADRPRRGWARRTLGYVGRNLLRFNTEVVPPLPGGRLLEVGCASGGFLASMRQKGWDAEGIEYSNVAAEKARAAGFAVQTSSIEAAAPPTHQYDLIVGWMVIEHLHDPVASLAKLAMWARPDGWLAISTPNVASFDFRWFRGSGYALHVPNHLYHFSPATLQHMLEKAGWKVEKVFHQRTLGNYVGSIGLKLEDIGAPKRLSSYFRDLPARPGYLNHWLYPIAWVLSLFGHTGRMTIWARKK